MPSNPTSPGVYITEVLTPITNNSAPGTANAVFAGAYNRGSGVPRLITSWNQFQLYYGTFSQAGGITGLHYATYQFFNNGGTQCYVLSVANTDAVIATHTFVDTATPTPNNIMTVKAKSPGLWGNQIYVALTTAGRSGRFNVQVYYGSNAATSLVETFIDLSVNPADTRNVSSIVNSPTYGSSFITTTVTLPGGVYTPGTNDPALVATGVALSTGADGTTAPTLSTAIPTALDTLQGQILNLNVPNVHDATTINALITWAIGRGDVMLVVDGPAPTPGQTSAQVVSNYTNLVTGGSPFTATGYATIYAPWIQILDPASSIPGATVFVPPGGAVLGVWSRTDTAVGPWQAPAGVAFGNVNLVNLEAIFNTTDLANLETNNINPIRFIPNYHPSIMGVRTLDQGFPDRYVSVRRMLMKLEHDFNYLLQPALFAPNNPALWQQVTQIITNYLTGLMQQGALGGTTQTETFQVTCDSTNNTPATAQAGFVNASVAVALNSPAEFIIITISQSQNTGTTTITTTNPGA